jgi:2-polyprenyl-3-methyl-5-hydroxy-6-metoxy-1,4-benzoquinol methylase
MNKRKVFTDITAKNAIRWEAIAKDRYGVSIEFFTSGGITLEEEELSLIGDIKGKRVLQLACSVGDEVISFAKLGAHAFGVDIAPTHIETARIKAEKVGVDVDLRVGDMMDLDEDLTNFDLIYISWGGICWVPDIHQWSHIIAERLAPGGQVLIAEHHPIWEVLGVTGERSLQVIRDYFGGTELKRIRDVAKEPKAAQRLQQEPEYHSFVWGLGALVSSLLHAGLTIDALKEYPEKTMYEGLGSASEAIPATYILSATLNDK